MTSRVTIAARYPTELHQQAATAVRDFFAARPGVEAVLLYGSCARGRASPDSCLDVRVLLSPALRAERQVELQQTWAARYESEPLFQTLRRVGRYSHVDLDFSDGQFCPKPRDWTSGPDDFELEIGNTLVYSVALWKRDGYLDGLKSKWLPFYDDELRRARLAIVRRYLENNLDHARLYVPRRLFFQAFKRVYDALYEFLQALFISRRVYPIAYDKWIREQVEEILGLPDLYLRLVRLLEVSRLESTELAGKARELAQIVRDYVSD